MVEKKAEEYFMLPCDLVHSTDDRKDWLAQDGPHQTL